ncbi:pyridoxal phosphate-dependent aminotransferase [Inconstantimicrobium mannanitabidum]|uniref:Aminotransferase n=1 Tax=Inconstantimicrobium mannanitabidum TaxID=1604901 RepID=A0ACB5RA67_9CLOT|nr:aminotransferase class I/II-fold pyridoxal phosphate-dependent enzyme [Clostridium sp. TW13]GKX66078.1 aminotransferase [Clostridium sp. TW13]
MNQRVLDVELSGIRKFSNKVSKVPGAISLTLGQPDFPVPKAIKEAMKTAIDEDKTVYTSNAGILELREEISNYLSSLDVNYDADEICITVGGSQGLFAVIMALINQGDKVLIPTPAYPAYESITKMAGGTVVNYTLNDDFTINIDEIEERLKDKDIKAIVISYPCNPTGAVLTKEDRDKLAELLAKHDVKVITDEIYAALCYEDKYYSVAQIKELRDKLIYVSGFSKMFSMTGLRLGYVCAPKEIMEQVMKVHQYNVSCATSMVQYATVVGLRESLDDVEYMRQEFQKRRDYVYSQLKDMGLEVNCPKGAFYIFPNIKKTGLTSEEFCDRLLNEMKVACVPGSAFGKGGEGYIRISYSYSMKELQKSLGLLREFIEKIKN